MGKSLADELIDFLQEYGLECGLMHNLTGFKYVLHSSLSDMSPYVERELYTEDTVKKAREIFEAINSNEKLLLVYDNAFNSDVEKEIDFIESILINIKRKENYNYRWLYEDGEEYIGVTRKIYEIEGIKIEDLLREISLSDFAGDYDLISSVFIVDIKNDIIFHMYDDRGLYLISSKEKILMDLWKKMPDAFFEDCHDFQIGVKKFYWVDGTENNREDLCLHGDLEIRLKEELIEYSATVSAAGLRLLRSLSKNHEGGVGEQLFPCCGNTMLANEEGNKVEILGCDQGLDWYVKHKDGRVLIGDGKALEASCYYLQYKKEVLDFVKLIEDFYEKAGDRVLPEDEIDRKGYLAFCKEWDELKKT